MEGCKLSVKITVMRKAAYHDLMAEHENPMENPCPMAEGMVFVSRHGMRPEALCGNAWPSLEPFVRELSRGGGNFYGNWMKNPKSAMISCNDGFRPVSFLIEVLEEKK